MENKETNKNEEEHFKCSGECGQIKPKSEFGKALNRKKGILDMCKVCNRKCNRKWKELRSPEDLAKLKQFSIDNKNADLTRRKKKYTEKKNFLNDLNTKNSMSLIIHDTLIEFYQEYIRLKGKMSFEEYKQKYEIFLKITSTWIGGDRYLKSDGTYCETREEEVHIFLKEAKISIEEYNRIFMSIDNIHPYS